ncbi:MAG: hypothetical protein E7174_00885 [Firmicutes bacterium]|nr:hypothetical protein [Bacillota bacterium]
MLKKYLNQDIDNPTYLFHGSPKMLSVLKPNQSYDTTGNQQNIANAIFLFPSFLKATPYAFKDTIKANSEGLKWNFEITNSNKLPLMTMENVNIDENIVGYIYVFLKDDDMIKDNDSYQYKCFKEKQPIDIIKITYKDFKEYYEIINKTKSK